MTKQARAERSRAALLRAAAELLRRDGYQATGMVAVAGAVGMTKGGLYFHFPSKDDLCDAVQASAVDTLANWLADHPSTGVQRVIDLTHALSRWLVAEPEVGASFRMAHEVAGHRFRVFLEAWVAAVRAELARAGNIAVPVDTAAALVSALSVGAEALGPDTSGRLGDMWAVVLPELVRGTVDHLRVDGTGAPVSR
ncbi:TetR/AcrR family transcriptional regulator [Actinokineospora auranticolor]|uniref:AcrR family transcriptional regulator n=1 Tax=Actinokineospora auranticolor TaxID=155976 RepID=A0A2S6GJT1_9PSEU|nr:TetR/AcrR family transcriptional regulator [Actinokineospora auranticolor]PPK65469.1 AcrR family transcriptional regulator [Actinokineospora auranticolor]